jgi:hypothetical protein
MAIERCANCDAIIGRLETPHLWNDAVVCAACAKRLTTQTASPVKVTPAEPGARKEMSYQRIAVISVTCGVIVVVLVYLQTYGGEAGGAFVNLLVACIPIALLVAVGYTLMWIIRRGVAQGVDDSRKGHK